MTKKIDVLVYSKEQKEKLYRRVMEADIMSLLPEIDNSYRWNLKISKDQFYVFEFELQKSTLGLWRRAQCHLIMVEILQSYGSVENCLKTFANDLLDMEEEKIEKNRVKKYNWIDGVFE